MASTLILGQSAPGATTITTLYTVPALTQTAVSSIIVCNRSSVDVTFRIAVRNAGAVLANEHYIYYDVNLRGNDTFKATMGGTLPAGTIVAVYASTANLSFNLFGEENT